jgi:hypothetical protein
MGPPKRPRTHPPALLIVDADAQARAVTEAALARRFGADYRVVTARTPSNRCGSSINTRLPSASTASFAVFHDTPRSSETRATVKC